VLNGELPTASQARGDVHETPTSRPALPSAGSAAIDQCVPFHFSTSAPSESPTAVQALPDVHEIEASWPSGAPAGSSARVNVQREPFQRSLNGKPSNPLSSEP
jgi:hypothetical protein